MPPAILRFRLSIPAVYEAHFDGPGRIPAPGGGEVASIFLKDVRFGLTYRRREHANYYNFFTAVDGGTLRVDAKFRNLFAGGSRNNSTNRRGRADIEKTMNISRMLRPVAFSLVLLLLCVSAYGQQQRVAVPNISMPTLDGKTWSLKDEAGKVVVLNFWATWCEPCRTEVPYLVRLRSEFGKKGLAVAGVTLDEDLKVVEKFVAEYKVDYPILIPPAGSPWTKLENTPTTLLIDREGRLAGKYIGAVPEEELRRDVEKLLAESRPD